MFYRAIRATIPCLLFAFACSFTASAQSPQLAESTQTAPANPAPASSIPQKPAMFPPDTHNDTVIVPVGTHLPLVLRNGINTRTAKPGDAVYFETLYPISQNNHIAIPMGSFVRGEIVSAKRPGRIAGRGEFRIALDQMTFLNGYTIDLRATPSSVDRDGREGVDAEGKIIGPSSKGRDTAIVLGATAGGTYIGTLAGATINGAAGRGALIGGGAAGIGALIAVLATRGPEAELPRGTTMDVVFDRPLILSTSYLPQGNYAGVDPQRMLPQPSDDARRRSDEIRKRRAERSILHSIIPLAPF
jgi:hypothetical protein